MRKLFCSSMFDTRDVKDKGKESEAIFSSNLGVDFLYFPVCPIQSANLENVKSQVEVLNSMDSIPAGVGKTKNVTVLSTGPLHQSLFVFCRCPYCTLGDSHSSSRKLCA